MPSTEAQVKAAVAGRYDVDREIGRGGMATVYLARDVKHNREVALKVLNPELGAVLGVERFLSEIQVTANLQHPHLLPLYDSGESNGLLYYVMPYVEGEGSLREMLNREKQLPVDDAVRIAAAVASALAYAHKKGVIHRDLKPENILLQGGQPFVADFGIALAVSMAGGNRITQTGLSLGTPQYMSPEQATGERVIDARSDIYSLGCMLYVMLAGEPPHVGGTAQAIIARVLTEKPRPVRQLRDTVPEQIEWAIDRALAKIPADRFSTAGEFHDALVGRAPVARPARDPRDAPDAQHRAPYSRRFTRSTVSVLLGGLLALTAVAAWKGTAIRKNNTPAARFYVTLPGASLIDGFSLSRDAKTLAYISGLGASRQLVVRGLEELEARPLPGTSGADHPLFSPGGQWIAFTANGLIRKTPATGGAAQVVGPFGFGYDWFDDETLIIGSGLAGTGLRRSMRPGAPLAVITRPAVDSGVMFHVYPLVLPENKVAFIVWGVGGLEDDYVAIGDLETGRYVESRLVAITTVAYQDGWLIYQDPDRRLMATRVDLGAMTVDPTPVVLQENVVSAALTPGASLTLTGQRTTGIYSMSIGVDSGSPALVAESDGVISGVRLAPDRRRIAYVVTRGDSAQLLVHDLRTRTSVRLWTGGGVKDPEWTPDGRSIVFAEGAPRLGLWRLSADGGVAPRLIVSEHYPRHPSISPDGGTVVYVVNVAAGANERRYDLWSASLVGAPAPRALAAERDGKSLPAISPNGRWLAYDSNENAHDDVYVRSFTGVPGRWRVSLDGGMEPRWSQDGQRLFYRSGGDVIAATLRETTAGIEVVSRARVGRFATSSLSPWDSMYDVSWDNKLFVASTNEKGWQLVFAQNWLAEFRQRVAGR